MKRIVKMVAVFVLLASFVYFGGIVADKAFLRREMIRLHVVAQSDSAEDQRIKLQVRDAVVSYLQANIPQDYGIDKTKAYLQEHLGQLEILTNEVLAGCGSDVSARVSLEKEAFPLRDYETFSLPSGVYESLRVSIGVGEGKNWWCVVFPTLCVGATSEDYRDLAVSAGVPDSLIQATAKDDSYEIRFFFLDCLGKLENLFHFR